MESKSLVQRVNEKDVATQDKVVTEREQEHSCCFVPSSDCRSRYFILSRCLSIQWCFYRGAIRRKTNYCCHTRTVLYQSITPYVILGSIQTSIEEKRVKDMKTTNQDPYIKQTFLNVC